MGERFVQMEMALDLLTFAVLAVLSRFIVRRFRRKSRDEQGVFQRVCRMMMWLSIVATAASSLLVVFNLPAIIPRNPPEWAADALVLWALPYLLGWPSDVKDRNERNLRFASWGSGVLASLSFLSPVTWCTDRLVPHAPSEWRNPGFGFIENQAALTGMFLPMAFFLSVALGIRYLNDRSKRSVVLGGAIIFITGVMSIAIASQGIKIDEPTMIFGMVSGTHYNPDNSLSGAGVRDTTDVTFYVGPYIGLHSSFRLCGNQLSQIRPGNYYRAIAQDHAYDVPWNDSSSETITKECYQLSGLEEWTPSLRRIDTASGVLQDLKPSRDDRNIEVNLRSPNGSIKTVTACADGIVLGELRALAGKSLDLELDTGLHSSNAECDPVEDIKLATVLGAVSASDPRTTTILLTLATAPPQRTQMPSDLANQLRQEEGNSFKPDEVMILPLSNSGANGVEVDMCDPEHNDDGCGIAVWAKRGDKYERILDSSGMDIRTLDEVTDGQRNLVVAGTGGVTVYQFNGIRYVDSECFMVAQDKKQLVGTYCAPKPMSTSSGQNASDPANTLDLSFSYTLPSDWEAFDDRQSLLAVQQQTEKSGATVEARRGINCTRKLMTSRHGKPYSVVSVSALPFACFGHEMPASDLPAFASGGWDNLKSEFDMSEMFWTDYSLGSHAVRAQRANGNIKGHPEIHYRIELVCTVLKKAAVCWTGLSTDDAAQRAFEQSTPKLDSDPATELVPENGVEWKMQL